MHRLRSISIVFLKMGCKICTWSGTKTHAPALYRVSHIIGSSRIIILGQHTQMPNKVMHMASVAYIIWLINRIKHNVSKVTNGGSHYSTLAKKKLTLKISNIRKHQLREMLITLAVLISRSKAVLNYKKHYSKLNQNVNHQQNNRYFNNSRMEGNQRRNRSWSTNLNPRSDLSHKTRNLSES